MLQVNEAASSLLQALPAPVSERLQAAAAAVEPTLKEFTTYAYSDPKAGAAAATVAVGLPLFVYWRARLSGYAGQLPPARAKAQLNRKNTLLIDIRCALHSMQPLQWLWACPCLCTGKLGLVGMLVSYHQQQPRLS